MGGHRQTLEASALPGYEPEIGIWLWAMEEVRRSLLRTVAGLDQAVLDWRGPDGESNSIGSLLYHIAGVEMGWLFFDVFGLKELPPEVMAHFPRHIFENECITHMPGVPLQEHLARLQRCRDVFLEAFRPMTVEDWRRLRSPDGEDYRVTPEWAVFHLVEHEAGHLFQIRTLKKQAKRYLAPA